MPLFTRRFFTLMALGIPAILAAYHRPGLAAAIFASWNLTLLAAAALDYMSAPARLWVRRHCDERLSLGAANEVCLEIQNPVRRMLRVTVKDEPPAGFGPVQGKAAHLRLTGSTSFTYCYKVVPPARGDYEFGDVNLRIYGFLGLGMRQVRIPLKQSVRVFPNLLGLRDYDLLVRKGRLIEAGIKPARIYGRGTEFETIREYVIGDDYRTVNWTATARRSRPMVNQYETDRSQNILLVVDAGRMMTVSVDRLTKMDHAVNAALMLGYAAMLHDDRVGLLAFADEVVTYVPPGKGKGQLGRIVQALYNLKPVMVEPDFGRALRFLAANNRKRSLVCLFTDVIDEEASGELLRAVTALKPVHLPVCISIADPEISATIRRPIGNSEDVYTKAAACEVQDDRHRLARTMQRRGVAVVDCAPRELTAATTRKYLEIKAQSRL